MKFLTLILLLMTLSSNAQFKPDSSLYPFKSRYFKTDNGKIHYIDEGEGPVILFVHGTPTWSFLWRNYIKELSKSYRCIAIDHLGFGLSDKPVDFDGRPEDHSKRLEALVKNLELEKFSLVVHDFGGPIGLSLANRMPGRINKLIIFNTWLWSTEKDKSVNKIDKLVNSWLGRFLYLNLNISPTYLLKKGFHEKSNLKPKVHDHYKNVFPSKTDRYGLLKLAKALSGSSDWYEENWNALDSLENKEKLFIWGLKDDFLGEKYLKKWKERFPNSRFESFECGHFVQEEEPEESLSLITSFLKN